MAGVVTLRAGYGKVTILDQLREQAPVGHNHLVYVGDGSSDVHVMLHVNRLEGLTIAVSENRYLSQIAKRSVLSDDALSILVPITEEILGWNTYQIRALFEQHGFILREWEKVQTDTLNIVSAAQATETRSSLAVPPVVKVDAADAEEASASAQAARNRTASPSPSPAAATRQKRALLNLTALWSRCALRRIGPKAGARREWFRARSSCSSAHRYRGADRGCEFPRKRECVIPVHHPAYGDQIGRMPGRREHLRAQVRMLAGDGRGLLLSLVLAVVGIGDHPPLRVASPDRHSARDGGPSLLGPQQA